jgi:hypothetical protein
MQRTLLHHLNAYDQVLHSANYVQLMLYYITMFLTCVECTTRKCSTTLRTL